MKIWPSSFGIVLAFFITFQAPLFSQEPPKTQDIEVELGIDKNIKLDFTPDTKPQVGDETILTFQLIPQRREITLKGLKAGTTSLIIRDTAGEPKAEYRVKITASDQSKIVQKLKELIGDVEGLEIGVKADEVYVGGQIIVPGDIGRVVVVLEKFPNVMRLIELAPQAQLIIAKKMQEEIQRQNMKDVTVRVVSGVFILEGIVSSASLKKKAEDIAKLMLPGNLQTLAAVTPGSRLQAVPKEPIQSFIGVSEKKSDPPLPKLIKVTAQFVELVKEYKKVFGFSWDPTLTDGGGTIRVGQTDSGGVQTKSDGTLSATISNLFPKLSSAKQAGFARVIQSGMVVVKEGVAGKIKKQETLQFSLGSGEFTKASTSSAAFEVNVKATPLQEELVEMELGIEVSVNEAEGKKQLANVISTTVTVKSKESAVIGGIVQNRSSTDYDKDPPGGVAEKDSSDEQSQNSQIFSFLKSKNHSRSKSQFVVFVTPELLESASQGTEEIKRKFRKRGR
jgi:pilus assembly protein CpaC